MSTKAPQLHWREGRRLRAWELAQQGWKQQDIAAVLGVAPGAVSQWLKRAGEQGGPEALRRHPASRWGDYAAMQVDPTDGCTFWFTTE